MNVSMDGGSVRPTAPAASPTDTNDRADPVNGEYTTVGRRGRIIFEPPKSATLTTSSSDPGSASTSTLSDWSEAVRVRRVNVSQACRDGGATKPRSQCPRARLAKRVR